jgi:spore coat polysaccharide biosynthesis predicted glycosyltransferase SpsG
VRLLVIDDEATCRFDAADIVLNSRLGLVSAGYASARTLLGEKYALLRPGLRTPAPVASPPDGAMLVMLGGTDPRGQTANVLHALAEVGAAQFAPIVVRSRQLPGGEDVARALERFSASEWIERADAPTLAGWARACRFAVSACGGAAYEFAFLGLPFVGLIVADNQAALGREVEARWKLPIIDARAHAVAADIGAGVRRLLLANPTSGVRASYGGIDGHGAARVAETMWGA